MAIQPQRLTTDLFKITERFVYVAYTGSPCYLVQSSNGPDGPWADEVVGREGVPVEIPISSWTRYWRAIPTKCPDEKGLAS